jgi:MoCo/4Fe-4S cofactor protein with predicted Tat translocation signal
MADSRIDMNDHESTYWRSLRELYDRESVSELKAHEFMSGVTDDFSLSEMSTMSRKQFLALLTASAAFAAAGCTGYRDKGEIVPYNKKPEEVIPGLPNAYASTCTGCNQACGILIKTREGRPVKVDGNPDHPVNEGTICAKGQASILNLYDPHRLRTPVHGSLSKKNGEVTWKIVDAEVRKHLNNAVASSKRIAIVAHAVVSPSSQKVLEQFAATYPTTKLYMYDLFHDTPRHRAWQRCYGSDAVPAIAWDKAKVILALESDVLGTEGFTVEQIRKFASARDIMRTSDFNRLYCVEGTFSLTGANADYRLRLRPDAQGAFLLALMNEVCVVRGAARCDGHLARRVGAASLRTFADRHGLSLPTLRHLVDDLLEHRGEAIVHAGDSLPESVHLLVDYFNEILGNSTLYRYGQTGAPLAVRSSAREFEQLVRDMNSGAVDVVLHFDTNPVFHLPPTIGYEEAVRKVPLSVSLVETEDETARLCTYVLPAHHPFESWGDFSVRTGVVSLQQPVIAPLYDTREKEAVLLTWMSADGLFHETIYHEFIKRRWEQEVFPRFQVMADFTTFWFSALHDGVVVQPEEPAQQQLFDPGALASLEVPDQGEGVVVALTQSHFLGDGRFANNGWLQEIPHPVSKIVWDNYAAISPRTAEELGVADSDCVKVMVTGAMQTLPVFVQPGQADGLISIDLGYGRTAAGPIGSGVGTNANVLLPAGALDGSRIVTGVKVVKATERHTLVSTQEHHSLDDTFVKDFHLKRKIIREGTLREYREDPEFLHHEKPELFSISKQVEYKGLKWAMAIDLNKCVGCSVCVSSCNVENNVPVVGKELVGKGREMQWIRIDRYYAGTPDGPQPSHQPMLCQQCDQAPCENVCPVSATNHSPDGLNQMVYNRCVGTRYCSNNCPYKVRRFNFFNYRDHLADGYYEQEPVSLVHNPEVTVRSRGVMEKCTFCIQRIMEARQHAIEQGRILRGSDVKTACQEACPAQAIVFGDMNDPESDISRYRGHALGYYVLEEVNVRPNVTYIARLRNVHPEAGS